MRSTTTRIPTTHTVAAETDEEVVEPASGLAAEGPPAYLGPQRDTFNTVIRPSAPAMTAALSNPNNPYAALTPQGLFARAERGASAATTSSPAALYDYVPVQANALPQPPALGTDMATGTIDDKPQTSQPSAVAPRSSTPAASARLFTAAEQQRPVIVIPAPDPGLAHRLPASTGTQPASLTKPGKLPFYEISDEIGAMPTRYKARKNYAILPNTLVLQEHSTTSYDEDLFMRIGDDYLTSGHCCWQKTFWAHMDSFRYQISAQFNAPTLHESYSGERKDPVKHTKDMSVLPRELRQRKITICSLDISDTYYTRDSAPHAQGLANSTAIFLFMTGDYLKLALQDMANAFTAAEAQYRQQAATTSANANPNHPNFQYVYHIAYHIDAKGKNIRVELFPVNTLQRLNNLVSKSRTPQQVPKKHLPAINAALVKAMHAKLLECRGQPPEIEEPPPFKPTGSRCSIM